MFRTSASNCDRPFFARDWVGWHDPSREWAPSDGGGGGSPNRQISRGHVEPRYPDKPGPAFRAADSGSQDTVGRLDRVAGSQQPDWARALADNFMTRAGERFQAVDHALTASPTMGSPAGGVAERPPGDSCRGHDGLQRALNELRSLQDGDLGVTNVVGFGSWAIPSLRALLFEREPSGLYQPRCRVVEALSALGAHDVLLDFLATPREIPDAVERMGEDAVINAAARALRGSSDPRLPSLLLALAQTRKLAGPIAILGTLRRSEAVPCLIEALGDDLARPAAEAAIRGIGDCARAALLEAATQRAASVEMDSESNRRVRRSALKLLVETGVPEPMLTPSLHDLLDDADAEIAFLACRIWIDSGHSSARPALVRRLIELEGTADWKMRMAITQYLAEHFELVKQTMEANPRA